MAAVACVHDAARQHDARAPNVLVVVNVTNNEHWAGPKADPHSYGVFWRLGPVIHVELSMELYAKLERQLLVQQEPYRHAIA